MVGGVEVPLLLAPASTARAASSSAAGAASARKREPSTRVSASAAAGEGEVGRRVTARASRYAGRGPTRADPAALLPRRVPLGPRAGTSPVDPPPPPG